MKSPKIYKKATAVNSIARDVAMQSYGELKEVFSNGTSHSFCLEITTGRVKRKILIPPAAIDVLLNFLKATAKGKRVAVTPKSEYLTTQSAAEWLGCSRPYLVKLLNENALPCTFVGKHRRIAWDDLRAYKKQLREQQRKQLIELMQADEHAGLYE
ncbi:MAG: excisionase family DNA-binding protein [Flavobacteriales bacterium]|jgi:excisionase family DNA binding protein